jgi:hypothetical protein
MPTDHPPQTESPTDRILVVLDADDPEPTLQAVVEETDATAAEVDLLAVYPTAEYEARRRARCDADAPGPYTLDQLAEEARRVARRAGREYLGPDPDGLDAMGAVGGRRECVRRAVRESDYSRLYVAERSRSFWQRLVGVETISTELARLLPDVVSVEAVEDVPVPSDDGSEVVFEPGPGPERSGGP